jgi:biopolymer transport protein ExbD
VGHLKKRKERREQLEFSLNVTSLMDVLTVLLFFLVKSYSVSQTALATPEGLRLPASVVKADLEETVSVSLTNKELRINNAVVATLVGGKFESKDLSKDGRVVLPLKTFLDSEYKKRNAVFNSAGMLDNLPPGRVMIQSDKDLSFGTVKFILHTAAVANYNDYEFVVQNPEE